MEILLNDKLLNKVKEFEELDHSFPFKKDKAIFLLNQIMFGTYNDEQFEETGWVSLCSDILVKTVGKGYNNYLNLFVEHHLVKKKNYWKQRNWCSRFTLLPEWFESSQLVEHIATDWALKKNNKKARVMPSAKNQYKSLWRWFESKDLTLDFEAAYRELESLKISKRRMLINMNSISQFMNGNKWFIRHNEDKRLHTNLTNMKSEIRRCLRFKGEPLVNIDINNSQIFFLLCLLDSINQNKTEKLIKDKYIISEVSFEKPNQTEFDRFKNLVLTGKFYHVLGTQLINDLGHRGIYKKLKYDHIKDKANYTSYREPKPLMKPIAFEVLFSKNNQYTKEKSWFKKQFPTIYNIIVKIKEHKYQKLALLLQNIEATAILDKVVKSITRFNKNIPLFTIHDSIMTTKEYVDEVEEMMKTKILEYTGFVPSISVEYY